MKQSLSPLYQLFFDTVNMASNRSLSRDPSCIQLYTSQTRQSNLLRFPCSLPLSSKHTRKPTSSTQPAVVRKPAITRLPPRPKRIKLKCQPLSRHFSLRPATTLGSSHTPLVVSIETDPPMAPSIYSRTRSAIAPARPVEPNLPPLRDPDQPPRRHQIPALQPPATPRVFVSDKQKAAMRRAVQSCEKKLEEKANEALYNECAKQISHQAAACIEKQPHLRAVHLQKARLAFQRRVRMRRVMLYNTYRKNAHGRTGQQEVDNKPAQCRACGYFLNSKACKESHRDRKGKRPTVFSCSGCKRNFKRHFENAPSSLKVTMCQKCASSQP